MNERMDTITDKDETGMPPIMTPERMERNRQEYAAEIKELIAALDAALPNRQQLFHDVEDAENLASRAEVAGADVSELRAKVAEYKPIGLLGEAATWIGLFERDMTIKAEEVKDRITTAEANGADPQEIAQLRSNLEEVMKREGAVGLARRASVQMFNHIKSKMIH